MSEQSIKDEVDKIRKNYDEYGMIKYKNDRVALVQYRGRDAVHFIQIWDEMVAEGYQIMSTVMRSDDITTIVYFEKVKNPM